MIESDLDGGKIEFLSERVWKDIKDFLGALVCVGEGDWRGEATSSSSSFICFDLFKGKYSKRPTYYG